MINFYDYMRNVRHTEVPEREISGEWFVKNNLPMIVACSCCGMTMALPSAWIDEGSSTYCAECAGE